jgi:hypothetical protein
MAGVQWISYPTALDTGSFRDWSKKLHRSILGAGFLDVSASGAILDFDTIDPLPLANQTRGFVVYSFNDTLQSTLPIYFRVDYGSGGIAGRAATYVIVGTEHDDSGTISGQRTDQVRADTQLNELPTDPDRRFVWFFGGQGTGADSYITFAGPCVSLEPTLTFHTVGAMWAIDRFRDATGSATPEGFTFFLATAGTSYTYHPVPATGSVNLAQARFPAALGANEPDTFLGKSVASPIFPAGRAPGSPSTALFALQDGNVKEYDVFTAEMYSGTPHVYIKLSVVTTVSGETTSRIAMRWD